MEPVKRYRCGTCDEIHDDEDGALECCPPEAYECYCCPVCGEAHDLAEDARDCCQSADEPEPAEPGRQFPKEATTIGGYIEEFCKLNNLTI